MDLEKAIKKPFTDIKKLLIGILLSIIPIVSWIAKGFTLECSGLGKNKASPQMPEWKDWGGLFIKGLVSWIIGLVYMIPTILIIIIGAGAALVALFKTFIGNIIPGGMIESVAAGETAPEALQAIVQQNWVQAIPALVGLAPIILLALLLALLAAYVLPVAVLKYIKSNKIGDAFAFGNVFKKAFTRNYFVVWIVVVIIGIILGAILHWIPVLGRAAAFFISGTIGYTLFGEVLSK